MSAKLQCLLTAIVAGITSYIAYFVALPPSLQTGIMGQFIAICPPSWQPAVAGTMRTASFFLTIYATYKAAHSSQQPKP